MTGRDRMVVIGLVVLAVLGAAWVLVVSPERKQASKLSAQVAESQNQLSSAESQLASAKTAQSQYETAYASIVSLGKAVPPSEEVPSLIDQLAQASNDKAVDFSSIVSSTGSATTATASAATTAAATPAAFTQMPFTFIFNGSFFDLDHLFQQLTDFTLQTSSGSLEVSGRLLTVQSVKLAPLNTGSGAGSAGSASGQLTGTITATAYVLPASQGLTGSASPPAGSTTPASSTGTSSSPTTPAIVRANP
jgi:type IV pilus assembly PilO-like protein